MKLQEYLKEQKENKVIVNFEIPEQEEPIKLTQEEKNKLIEDQVLSYMPPRFKDLKPNWELLKKLQTKSLLITGNVGTGKTRMLLEILFAYLLNGGEKILIGEERGEYFYPNNREREFRRTFKTFAEILTAIKDEFNEKERFWLDEFKNKDILFIDDLGTEKVTDWAKEQIQDIINHRYNWNKPVVITTNLTIKEIADLYGERLASRLVEMSETIKLSGKDRRTEK